jgi:hypothetical protein
MSGSMRTDSKRHSQNLFVYVCTTNELGSKFYTQVQNFLSSYEINFP